MRRSFKYRLWTNANQDRELGIMLETHRRLYNECLSLRQMTWQCYKVLFSYADSSRWFKGQRGTNPYFRRLNFSSAQTTLRQLDRSFANFYRRVREKVARPGYPRFRTKDRCHSFTFPKHRDGVRLTGTRLYVQNVGSIRVKLHRPVEGKINTVTLKREVGKWYVIFSCDLGVVVVPPSMLPTVGIDVGLESFLTTSNGTDEPNPRYHKGALPQLRVAGRAVARKKKGGTSRRKAVRRLQKVHTRVRNLRREHHHAVACRLVLAFGLIVAERLTIKRMLRNGKLSRAISDAGWASFLDILSYKAEKAGAQYVEIDSRDTSQECSGCGQEVRKKLSVRWHDCPSCGLSIHRDHNAAQNILARGLARTGPAEVNVGHQAKRPPRNRRVAAME